jgi:hypothetical protein
LAHSYFGEGGYYDKLFLCHLSRFHVPLSLNKLNIKHFKFSQLPTHLYCISADMSMTLGCVFD